MVVAVTVGLVGHQDHEVDEDTKETLAARVNEVLEVIVGTPVIKARKA